MLVEGFVPILNGKWNSSYKFISRTLKYGEIKIDTNWVYQLTFIILHYSYLLRII
jgi:hypothetical protein